MLSNSITYPGNDGVVEKSSTVLWFDCISPGNGVELCKSDGTISGTSVATDMVVGNLSSSPRAAITSGEYVFFIAKGDINDINKAIAYGPCMRNLILRALQSIHGLGKETIQTLVYMETYFPEEGVSTSLLRTA